ncbi:MAG: carbon storage regulator [Phycisphaeraceae bacterium]|nr:carbon storage regulator [Phycisphaeraceae bacterium]
MLVMTRREHEAIVLRIDGAPVVIQVTRIAGDRIRLGITAPSSIAVNRAEVELDLIEQAAEQTPLVVTTPEDAETVRTLARSREMLTAIANTSDYGVALRARELLARLFGGKCSAQPLSPSAPSAPSAVNALSLPPAHA